MHFPVSTERGFRFGSYALAVVAVAGALLPARPAHAFTEDLEFYFTNGRNEVVRGSIANQGATVFLQPGQKEVIKSRFTGQASKATHVIRFEPHKSSTPKYCEWTVDIVTSLTHPYWTCTVSAAREQGGAHCDGYAQYRGNYNCFFDFIVK
jgi:hypothetical protein